MDGRRRRAQCPARTRGPVSHLHLESDSNGGGNKDLSDPHSHWPEALSAFSITSPTLHTSWTIETNGDAPCSGQMAQQSAKRGYLPGTILHVVHSSIVRPSWRPTLWMDTASRHHQPLTRVQSSGVGIQSV